jgi:hypothetical protein
MAEDPRLTNILKLLFPGGAPVDTANAEANSPAFNPGITGQPMDPNAKPIFSETVDTSASPIVRNSIPSAAPTAAPQLPPFLQRLFGGLTKTGVQDTSGKQQFYNDPSQAGVALAQQMRPMAQPQTSDISGPISAPGSVQAVGQDYAAPAAGGVGPPQDPNTQYGYDPSSDPSPTFQSPGSGGLLPNIFRPSFRQASTDAAGNVTRSTQGLTKKGVLMKILLGGLQGVADGVAGGALDAVPGRSPFGAGVQGAIEMPQYRQQVFQRKQRADLENQVLQAQVKNIPFEQQKQQAGLEATQAETAFHKAEATRALRGQMPPKGSPLEMRQAFATEHADMFKDTNEKKNFVLYGQAPKAATKNPTEWSLRVDAANGDLDAQAVLDQRNRDQRVLAGIRHAGNSKQAAAEDAASAEEIAAKIMNSSSGDPDRALSQFDQLSPNVTDPQQRRLGPLIRRAIRGRKRINKPQSPIDKILSGDVEGGLNQMQQPQQ